MKQLLPSSHDGVFIFILPLQRLRKPLHKSSQSAAGETLKQQSISSLQMFSQVQSLQKKRYAKRN